MLLRNISQCRGNSNIRELEGLLIRVIAFGTLTRQPITIELAQKVLARTVKQSQEKSAGIDFEKIVSVISKQSGYSFSDLCSKNRNKDISEMRHIAMFLMKKHTQRSLRDIGSFLGGRDHSTVMHGLQKIQSQLENEIMMQEKVKAIEHQITSL